MTLESSLKLSGIGFPPLSCRGATQTLTPIPQGEIRRSVNGELCYVGCTHHHKYKSTIACADKNIPGLQQLWVGAIVQVACMTTLWERIARVGVGDIGKRLSRPVVEGSLELDGNERSDAMTILVSYRPLLAMRITHFDFKEAEWEDDRMWRLALEEV